MNINIFDYIKSKFMNSSIRTKMILVNCTIIFIVAVSIGATSYKLYQETITNRLAAINQRDLKQIGTSIDYMLKDIEDMSSFIGTDHTVNRAISYSEEEIALNFSDQSYIKYIINHLLVSKNYISFISIYANNGFSYYVASDKSSNIPSFESIKNTAIYQKALSYKGAPFWEYIPKSDTSFILNNKSDKISMFRTLLKLNDYSAKAFMMISLNLSSLSDLFDNILGIENSTVIFLNSQNEPFLYKSNMKQGLNVYDMVTHIPKDALDFPEGTRIYPYNGEEHLLTYISLRSGWKILSVVPLKSYAINLRYVPVIVIVIFILALILGFYFTTFTSSLLTKPIKNLVESMARVKKGNFQEKVTFKYNDEIGELGQDYNEMISYINNLLSQVYALEIEERIAELKALQAQINPHFLYNTLDAIYWKAVGGDNKGVQEMIHALSKVFRLALNVGKEFFYISQEKEFIEYYILLQEKRYKNKLKYDIDFSSDILYHQIPKLILQPFVENAIIHGAETNDRITQIWVAGFLKDDKIHFVIKDNGTGISQEKLKKLLNPDIDDASPSKGGYGIKNVINRLAIYYGGDYSLDIKSEPDQGTTVYISIPTSPKFNIERN
ncbi:MAG: sensor histidine kinase [Clostridiaceae bacterium]|nr:sensor histidine kinase [Clostridiaceae bacterium]